MAISSMYASIPGSPALPCYRLEVADLSADNTLKAQRGRTSADRLLEVLLRSKKTGVAFVFFRYQKETRSAQPATTPGEAWPRPRIHPASRRATSSPAGKAVSPAAPAPSPNWADRPRAASSLDGDPATSLPTIDFAGSLLLRPSSTEALLIFAAAPQSGSGAPLDAQLGGGRASCLRQSASGNRDGSGG